MSKASTNKKVVSRKRRSEQSIQEKIAEAMQNFKASRKRIHIISYGNRWGILREGARRLTRIFSDKTTAVSYAKKLAQRDTGSSVIIHKKNGNPEESLYM